MTERDLDDGMLTILFWAFCIGFGAIMGWFFGTIA